MMLHDDIPRDISPEDKLSKYGFLSFVPTYDRILHAILAKVVSITESDYHVPFFSLPAIVKLIPADSSESRPDSMALPHLRSHRKAGVIGIACESVTGL